MNAIEIERDTPEPWAWAQKYRKPEVQPMPYTPPQLMSDVEHKKFRSKLGKNFRAQYRHRRITKLAARVILAVGRR